MSELDKPDMRRILDHYELEYPDRRGWAKVHCFNPDHEDRVASATVNLDEGAFQCHACGAKGDVFNLIMMREHCDFKTALALAESIAGGGDRRVRKTPFSGRRVPAGKGFRPRYKRGIPARLRPFSDPRP